ncbi:Survival protein SurA precursor (Peptidyl-prolyl cis-trans isomerase SurA) [Desulfurella amilsii]|uniref:Survival protein SurA (Peptidyl-prolyl cis-trans isomerase SurA) n=1 Tax=Desulfurella amilsii TaxID=1562698 RepID=A0A1X4XZJ4_9BACT|nr:peptidyl-prolyl cis-trans isomerase [Desulfurella amilsii]OSS42955.1 Survival protein SurA precursor (Peptidyl-prolyl cis-trans isomerase SurA) [Desulfurella amilsii]
MKKFLVFIVATIFFVSIAKAEIIDKIMATVNDRPITTYDLKELAPFYHAKDEKQLLNDVIDDYVIEDIAKKEGIALTDEDINQFIENVAKNNKLTKDQLEEKIKQQGLSYDYYKEFAKFNAYKLKVMQKVFAPTIQIDEQEIKNFYNNHSNLFNQSTVVLDIIKTSNKADTEDAMKQLQLGASFDSVKEKYSIDKSEPKKVYVADINKQLQGIIEKMQVDQISPIIESSNGYFIIKVLDKKDVNLPFDEVKDKIRNLLFEEKLQERFASWLNGIKSSMDISIFNEN